MWLDKLKEIIALMRLKDKEVAAAAGMSASGFHDAIIKGSFRFDSMIKLLKYYNINYYDLVGEEYSYVQEPQSKYVNPNKNSEEINKIIEKLEKNYEDRLKKSEDYTEHLKGQVTFLQQIIAKNIGLGETTSHIG